MQQCNLAFEKIDYDQFKFSFQAVLDKLTLALNSEKNKSFI